MVEKITLSVIKADVGGYVGHLSIHQNLLDVAKKKLTNAEEISIIIDFHVSRVGDDIELIMTHPHRVDNENIHKLAWDTFVAATEEAKKMKLYGAGQGPFEPHRLGLEELEYTIMPQIMKKLENRFRPD